MRFIKLGVISVAFFLLLILIISLMMPSTIFVSRSINISAPEDSVFAYLNDLHKWKLWCAGMDNVTVTYSAQTTGRGATAKVDKTVVIIDSVSSKNIAATWQTSSSTLNGSFSFLPNENPSVTLLQWQFVNHVKWYPWEKFAAIFSDKVIGGYMEMSLDKLKGAVEKK